MSSTLRTLVLTLLCVGAAPAQESTPSAPGDQAPLAAEAPPPVGPIARHSLIHVTLRNGSVFLGVAVENRLIERRVRAFFEPVADRTSVGAGVRVWYCHKLAGFVFLRHADIAAVEVLRPLADADLATWLAQKGRDLPPDSLSSAGPALAAPAATAGGVDSDGLDTAQRELLQLFPARAGWTPDRYETMQRESILAGREFTADEAAWNTVYPDWLIAYRIDKGEIKGSRPSAAAPAKAALRVPPPAAPAAPAAPRPASSSPLEERGTVAPPKRDRPAAPAPSGVSRTVGGN